jgi:hypothetical protein
MHPRNTQLDRSNTVNLIMSDFADIMNFLWLTHEARLSSPPLQTVERVFQAHLQAKEAVEAWLKKMELELDEYESQEDSSNRMGVDKPS